jgi:hypothetical protein
MRKMKCCKIYPGTTFTTLHFLVTYKEAQEAGVLHYNRVERLAGDKHSWSLDSFVIYEENEVL